jgi:hypothetical protein
MSSADGERRTIPFCAEGIVTGAGDTGFVAPTGGLGAEEDVVEVATSGNGSVEEALMPGTTGISLC